MNKTIVSIFLVFLILFGCTQTQTTNTVAENTQGVVVDQNTPTSTTLQNQTISIKNFAFSPTTLTIKVGTTITWTNFDNAPHTVTGGELNSPNLANGDKYVYTFNTPGTIDYICTIHPSMKGKIIVQ